MTLLGEFRQGVPDNSLNLNLSGEVQGEPKWRNNVLQSPVLHNRDNSLYGYYN